MNTGFPSQVGDRPLVSVVVATYDRSAVLRRTIDSVLGQTMSSWEMIVVGDGCTDDTEDVVAAFGDDRIRFVNLARRTGEQTAPNNVGIEMARGDFVAFLNHDDLWLPGHLEQCWTALAGERADVVVSAAVCIGARAAVPLRFDDLDVALVGVFPDRRYSPVDGIDLVAPASCIVIRRSGLERLGRWRHSSETAVEPSQDLVFRAWRRRMNIHALNMVTVVIVSAGHRPGSYLDTRADEADWLLEHVVVPDLGVEVAALALETNAAFASRQPRRAWWVRHGAALVARLGINPRAVRFRQRDRFGRGQYLDHLRALRGVVLPGGDDPPAARLRRDMVERACRIDVGDTVQFRAGGRGARLLAAGWSRPDSQGVWNDGDVAEMVIDVGRSPVDDLELVLGVRYFELSELDGRRADISSGTRLLACVGLDRPGASTVRVPLPADSFRRGRTRLRFEFVGSVSPRSAGLSDDERMIALGLVDATVVDAQRPCDPDTLRWLTSTSAPQRTS